VLPTHLTNWFVVSEAKEAPVSKMTGSGVALQAFVE
jgi:hypothetical protein